MKRSWLRYALAFGITITLSSLAIAQQAEQTPQAPYRILHKFQAGADGALPEAGLARDAAGNLYGTTFYGPKGAGTVFKVDTAGKKTILHAFAAGADGAGPTGDLTIDAAGNLYGTTTGSTSSNGTIFKLDKAGHETVLFSFNGFDGASPTGRLLRDHAGTIYGTTTVGGDPNCNSGKGCGVVFKLDKNGAETTLHQFKGTPDGAFPFAGLVQDASGNLYGTTSAGGDPTCLCGTAFELDTSSKETVLHNFTGSAVGGDGAQPLAGLVRDAKGNLFGTTSIGGANNDGTVFKLDAAGTEAVLYSFTAGVDGANPHAGLIQDAAGNLYGTTYDGAGGCPNEGCGTVFVLDTTGKETTLHVFAGGKDGQNPTADLIRDASGTFYGTTEFGGGIPGGNCGGGCGTVFRIHP